MNNDILIGLDKYDLSFLEDIEEIISRKLDIVETKEGKYLYLFQLTDALSDLVHEYYKKQERAEDLEHQLYGEIPDLDDVLGI